MTVKRKPVGMAVNEEERKQMFEFISVRGANAFMFHDP